MKVTGRLKIPFYTWEKKINRLYHVTFSITTEQETVNFPDNIAINNLFHIAP